MSAYCVCSVQCASMSVHVTEAAQIIVSCFASKLTMCNLIKQTKGFSTFLNTTLYRSVINLLQTESLESYANRYLSLYL